MTSPLEDTHQVLSLILSPSMLGWPVRRTRMFSAGLNRNKIAWLGPESSEDLLEDFMSFFAASVEVDGGVFLISSEEDVLAEEKRMARCRGHNFFLR